MKKKGFPREAFKLQYQFDYFFMNPRIEEITPRPDPTKNKINPIPYENIPALSPISRDHFIEINIKRPDMINVPIENKCFLFARNEKRPINPAKTRIIVATVWLSSSAPLQRDDNSSTNSFPEIIGKNVDTITNSAAPNPSIVFLRMLFKFSFSQRYTSKHNLLFKCVLILSIVLLKRGLKFC